MKSLGILSRRSNSQETMARTCLILQGSGKARSRKRVDGIVSHPYEPMVVRPGLFICHGGYVPGIVVDGGTSRTTYADGGFVPSNIVDGGLSRTIHTDGGTSRVCQDPILRGNNYDCH